MAGRDLELRTGNTDVASCTPGAFLVHEQMAMGGNTTLDGQVIVDNRGSCSDELTSPALELNGTAVIKVTSPPPIPAGAPIVRRSWVETAW